MTETSAKQTSDFDARIVDLFASPEATTAPAPPENSAQIARPSRKRGRRWVLIAALLGGASAAAFYAPDSTKDSAVAFFQDRVAPLLPAAPAAPEMAAETTAMPAAPVAPATVAALPVAQQTVFSGYVVARDPAAASLRAPGRVNDIFANVGQRVAAGDILAQLDDRDARNALEGARLAHRAAQARVDAAQATVDHARDQLARARALADRNIGTAVSVEEAEFTLLRARHDLVSQQIAAEKAAHDVALQETVVANHVIRAPADGIVSELNISLGAWHAPGAFNVCGAICSAFVLVNPEDLEIEGEIVERRQSNVSVGDTVSFHSVADPGVTGTGRITRISPSLSREKATLQVAIAFDTQDHPGFAPNVAVKIIAEVPVASASSADSKIERVSQ